MKHLTLLALLFPLLANAEVANIKTSGGRYQLIQLSSMARDQFLLDTQTGRVWQRRCIVSNGSGECVEAAWMDDIVQGLSMSNERLNRYMEIREGQQRPQRKVQSKSKAPDETNN